MTIDYNLIDDYLANRLNEEQLESFEIDLLDNPDLQEAVLAQRALKEGLSVQSSVDAKKNSPITSIVDFFVSPVWSCAATVLLAVCVSYLWLGSKTSQTTQIDRITYIETVRGSTSPNYSIKANEGNLLVVDVDPNSTGPYQIIIRRDDEIFNRQSFPNATNYSLNIIAPPLEIGNYTLVISNIENETEYQFEVVE